MNFLGNAYRLIDNSLNYTLGFVQYILSQVEVGVDFDHLSAVIQRGGKSFSTQNAILSQRENFSEDNFPVINLAGHHYIRGKRGLISLSAKPISAGFLGFANGTNHHLG